MADAYGSITWWGFSPAIDLQDTDACESVENLNLEENNDDELNVLLIGFGDGRHILKTIAHAYRHKARQINFYVIETSLELYARNILMLMISLEPQARIGLQEKTELFLEIFGNSLVRQQSMSYVEKMSTELIKMVTDFDYLHQKLPIVDLSLLKFKERDMLEGIFKFWRINDPKTFDIKLCWDLRLRRHLGVRFDAIPNIFDWDYSMKLTEKDAAVISSPDYSRWRQYGVAFGIREGNYNVPNRTLASGMVFNVGGEKVARRGYWGDIVVSPYISYGIESEEKSFFKKANNTYMKNAQDVSEFNVMSMLHELAHGERYTLPDPATDPSLPEKQTATLTEITEESEIEDIVEEENPKNEGEEVKANDADECLSSEKTEVNPLDLKYEAMPVDRVRVHFLPISSLNDIHKKSRYQQLFNRVCISNSMVHRLTEDLATTFASGASLMLETSKFMLEVNDDMAKEFLKKITSLAENIGCKATKEAIDRKDAVAYFTFRRKSSS